MDDKATVVITLLFLGFVAAMMYLWVSLDDSNGTLKTKCEDGELEILIERSDGTRFWTKGRERIECEQ